eukprot:1188168-Pleurochrysis_carterae.AAC.1
MSLLLAQACALCQPEKHCVCLRVGCRVHSSTWRSEILKYTLLKRGTRTYPALTRGLQRLYVLLNRLTYRACKFRYLPSRRPKLSLRVRPWCGARRRKAHPRSL